MQEPTKSNHRRRKQELSPVMQPIGSSEPLVLVADATPSRNRDIQFPLAHNDSEKATLAQREELKVLLQEKDQLFYEFTSHGMTVFLTHGVIPLLDDSESFAKKMDALFLAYLETLLPRNITWVARNGAASHIMLLIFLYFICSAAIYLISRAFTKIFAHLSGANRRSNAAYTALAKEMVSKEEVKHHIIIIRKNVEANKYILELSHHPLMTMMLMISKIAKMLNVFTIMRSGRFNFNTALYVSPQAIMFYKSYEYGRRGMLIDTKLQQDKHQHEFLNSVINGLPVTCAITTPVFQFSSFFILSFDELQSFMLGECSINISTAHLVSEVELALTEIAHFTVRERNNKSLIISPKPIINSAPLLEETRQFLVTRLRQISLHKEYVHENLRLLRSLSSAFSYREWFWLEYDDEKHIPVIEFRFDGDKLSDQGRHELLTALKQIYSGEQVSCDDEDIVVKGCIVILMSHKNRVKELSAHLKTIAAQMNEDDRAEKVSSQDPVPANAELHQVVVVCEKPKKEKKQSRFLPFFRQAAGPIDHSALPAQITFPVGNHNYVYHRGDENKNPPGPVAPLHLNNMKPGRKFYATDADIAQEFPTTLLFEEYRKIAQKGYVVNNYSQQGLVRRAVYYRDVRGQRHISDYQVSLPGHTGVINVSLAAVVRTEDKVLRKLYVGDHYDPHPDLPKPR